MSEEYIKVLEERISSLEAQVHALRYGSGQYVVGGINHFDKPMLGASISNHTKLKGVK